MRFNDGKKGQKREPVRDKDAIADIGDISGDIDNCLPFKNNVKYE